tara:strand:+ start:294 stop:1007 length:714 start_codon:yes stop_codon:yes gene_type:complete
MSNYQERARIRLELIYQDLTQDEKNVFAGKLFSGSDESNRRSTRRLISGSRKITDDKISFINRSYGQRKKKKVYDAESFEKADVTQYFKGYVKMGQRAWNGSSPPFAFLKKYRIKASASIIQFEPGFGWVTRQEDLWPQGSGSTFRELANLLQEKINYVFERYYDPNNNTDSPRKTWAIALSDSGEDAMVDAFNSSREVSPDGSPKNDVFPIGGDLKVEIFSLGAGINAPKFRDVRN